MRLTSANKIYRVQAYSVNYKKEREENKFN